MKILSQDGKLIANSDTAAAICMGEGEMAGNIYATYPVMYNDDCMTEVLGRYSSADRANAVLRNIFEDVYRGIGYFEMPRDDGGPNNCDSCERSECPYAQLDNRYRPRHCDYYYSEIPF